MGNARNYKRLMRALRVENNGLRLADIERPNIVDETLVRVTMSGICNTDLEIVRGYAGFSGTIGHEFVGVVESAADATHLIGKRVVGEINAGCGKCVSCLAGDPRHCPDRTVLGIVGRDGAHAEFLSLPSRNLLEVPAEVTDEQAVFTEPLAAAFGITEQLQPAPEHKIAVIGDGKLGILCAQALAIVNKNVTLIGKHKEKLKLTENRGIESLLLPEAEKIKRGFDVVVEASGSESGFGLALDLLRTRGKLVLKSTFHGQPKWPAWRVVVDEITIIGSRCGQFAPALEILRNRQVDVESLISEEYRLSSGLDA